MIAILKLIVKRSSTIALGKPIAALFALCIMVSVGNAMQCIDAWESRSDSRNR